MKNPIKFINIQKIKCLQVDVGIIFMIKKNTLNGTIYRFINFIQKKMYIQRNLMTFESRQKIF